MIVVGALSTVISYTLEQYSVRIVGRGGLAVLLALLSATATLVGAVALGARPQLRPRCSACFAYCLEVFDEFAGAIEAEFWDEYENGLAATAATRIQTINKVLSGALDG